MHTTGESPAHAFNSEYINRGSIIACFKALTWTCAEVSVILPWQPSSTTPGMVPKIISAVLL
jgi:hypothetical protein